MSAKTFRSASVYSQEIPLLVPGHGLVRELALATIAEEVRLGESILIVGAGPGDEVVALGKGLPGVRFEVLEPSPPMFDACAAAVEKAGLGDRVTMYERCLGDVSLPKSAAALSLFVSHLLGDEERRRYWSSLGDALLAKAPVVWAEIGAMEERERSRWLRCCESRMRLAGVPPEPLLKRLEANLSGGFPLRSPAFSAALAHGAGFRDGEVLLQSLGLRLERWRYRG